VDLPVAPICCWRERGVVRLDRRRAGVEPRGKWAEVVSEGHFRPVPNTSLSPYLAKVRVAGSSPVSRSSFALSSIRIPVEPRGPSPGLRGSPGNRRNRADSWKLSEPRLRWPQPSELAAGQAPHLLLAPALVLGGARSYIWLSAWARLRSWAQRRNADVSGSS